MNDEARPDSGALTREFALPERIPQDHGRRRAAGQIISRAEEAASSGRNPKRGKELAAYSKDGDAPHLVALADAFASVSTIPSEDAGEGLLVFADLLEQRIAEIVRSVRNTKAAITLPGLDVDQPVRFGDRKAPQAHGVEQLEDSRIRANTEGQRGDCSERESRSFPKGARSVSEIL